MGARLCVIYTSQSNGLYPGRGETGPALTACGYYGWSGGTTDGTSGLMVDAPGAGAGQGGSMYTILRILSQVYKIPSDGIDLTYGSSFYNEWMPLEPGAQEGRDALAQLEIALAALKTRHPNDYFIFIDVRNQGTSDARQNNYQYQSGEGYPSATYPGWALGFRGLPRVGGAAASWHDALEDTVALYFPENTLVHYCVVESNRNMTGQFFQYTIQDQQALAVSNVSGGREARLIPLRDDAGYDVADGVHMIAASCTITTGSLPGIYPFGGFQWKGNVEAAALKSIWDAIMGSLSSFAKNTLIDHFRNKSTYSAAATHYLGAFVAGVEVTGNGYERASATNNTTTWPNAAARSKSSGVAFTWPTATGTWGIIDEVRVFDASSGGNELARHTLVSTVTITATKTLVVASGAITISAPAGGLVDSVVHGLLDLMFGGTAYAQLTTTYGSYWAGDPQGAGAQAGSRVSITQASTWGAASGGRAVTTADVSITDQATGTYWAEHDAAAAGNLLCSGLLPAIPSGGKVAAGRLLTTLT